MLSFTVIADSIARGHERWTICVHIVNEMIHHPRSSTELGDVSERRISGGATFLRGRFSRLRFVQSICFFVECEEIICHVRVDSVTR